MLTVQYLMQKRNRSAIATGMLFWGSIVATSSAFAGMTSYGLNEVYKLRLQELSFFVVLLAACTVLFRMLWNVAAKGMSAWPQLTWKQAFCMSTLLGIVMLLVLMMISGIREVLTPGAWRRQGASYQLNSPAQEPARERSIEQLRFTLLAYAERHGGQFPAHDFSGEIPDKLWEAPDGNGTHYVYLGGSSQTAAAGPAARLLAFEPPNFGDSRFVLLATGEIRKMLTTEINDLLNEPGSGGGK